VIALLLEVDSPKGLAENPRIIAAMVTAIGETVVSREDDQRAKGAPVVSPLLILKDLLRKTSADKIQIGETEVPGDVHKHFDSHFGGRLVHLFKVCFWVGQLNFGGASLESP
jgi:hypothetical protein